MFVALVGPDGAGKTTVAAALERAARANGSRFAYVHWIPTSAAPPGTIPPAIGEPPEKLSRPEHVGPGEQVLSVARLFRNLLRFWRGYVLGMRRCIPGLRGSAVVVVADRWIYNYLAQPWSVAYLGPDRLARLAVWLAPRPDLTVVLAAPPEVVVARKAELTLAEAEAELDRWSRLNLPNRVLHLDATKTPESIARAILDAA